MKYIRISYDICEKTPRPKGLNKVIISQKQDISKGDISNVYQICFSNHVGTHIDGPNHFNNSKQPINSFGIGSFIFNNPVFLDIPKTYGQLITKKDLYLNESVIITADILLLRTGFSRIRKQDVSRYEQDSPGISSEVAKYLMEEKFKQLEAIAIDTLSFASPRHLDEGIKAHQIFMNDAEHNVFLIEDLNLDFNYNIVKKIFVIPLFIKGFDSSQCTVFCELE
ncbi:MAG: cyclase family protein [Bacteroidetes bacterium]|nr:cyclase family protein [Bacteroidota bacterium]